VIEAEPLNFVYSNQIFNVFLDLESNYEMGFAVTFKVLGVDPRKCNFETKD
jgi:hypothetical protein